MQLNWCSTSEYKTDLHPDTIEFSPDGRRAFCGSYELDQSTGVRRGTLHCFSSKDGIHFSRDAGYPCPGILDLAWFDDITVLSAHADGTLGVWSLSDSSNNSSFYKVHPGGILLSVETFHGKIVLSDSDGNVHLWELEPAANSTPSKVVTLPAHQFEAWCASLDIFKEHIIYSGADDGRCCVWDTREPSRAVCTLKHEMGVCSVRNHPTLSNQISTGCYDECLRIWDLRMLDSSTADNLTGAPTALNVCSIGGGVWRHKWSPEGDWVLIAAMHAGFAIANLTYPKTDNTSKGDCCAIASGLAERFRPSAQLAYGVDWIQQPSSHISTKKWTVGTCSFYDDQIDFSQFIVSAI